MQEILTEFRLHLDQFFGKEPKLVFLSYENGLLMVENWTV